MFQKYGSSRATTAGVLENVRMVLESAMVDGMVGSNQVLRSLQQKRAFLLALHPKDRLRLLHMVISFPPLFFLKDPHPSPVFCQIFRPF